MGNHLELYQRDGGQGAEVGGEAVEEYAEEEEEEDAGISSGSSLHFTGKDADDTDDDNGDGEEPTADGGPQNADRPAAELHGGPPNADGPEYEADGEGGEPHGEYMAYGEWKHFDYDTTGVTHFVAHHKNDRLV